jgi:hypothetical protein
MVSLGLSYLDNILPGESWFPSNLDNNRYGNRLPIHETGLAFCFNCYLSWKLSIHPRR